MMTEIPVEFSSRDVAQATAPKLIDQVPDFPPGVQEIPFNPTSLLLSPSTFNDNKVNVPLAGILTWPY